MPSDNPNTAYTIRAFNIQTDLAAATLLTGELGYPTTEAQFKKRMETLHQDTNCTTYVIVYETSVIGYAGIVKQYFWEQDGFFFKIQALVIKKEHRKHGAGTMLMQYIAQTAKASGATSLLLNSGNRPERAAAHQFYLNLGFAAKSTGFRKEL